MQYKFSLVSCSKELSQILKYFLRISILGIGYLFRASFSEIVIVIKLHILIGKHEECDC